MSKLNPTDIMVAFYQIAKELAIQIRILQKECNRYVKIREEVYKDIGDFDLPMDCNNMTSEETKNIYQLLEELFGISE